MKLRVGALLERLRSSFFFVPMMAVVAGIVLGQGGVAIDRRLGSGENDLPLGLSSTVDSARAVLSTVAGATITVAGIAFSVSLLVIQLASSQYSPRVVHTLFRDPFNKRVMALVVGTFTYCLIVLRSVRSAIEDGGEPVIPNLSVAVAVLLGVAAVLGIVAFINHSAHSMNVSEILEDVRGDAMALIDKEWPVADPGTRAASPPDEIEEPGCTVRFARNGWVQQIDTDALLRWLPESGAMRVKTYPGRYAIQGTVLCTLSAPPPDPEAAERGIRGAVALGDTRTMQQDASYGLRQLVDVALKALSPGINDPTTAQDAIFHATAVLGELLRRDPPPVARWDEDRCLVLSEQHNHEDLVRLTFDEVRRAAASQPTVCVYLLEAIKLLHEAIEALGLPDRLPLLAEQARLVVDGCEAAGVLPADLELVHGAYAKRFGPPT